MSLRRTLFVFKMPYNNVTALNIIYLSQSWIPCLDFINTVINGIGQSFQTQSARDEFRAQIIGLYRTIVTAQQRFPASGQYVWANSPTLRPIILAVFQALDTRNRIIEVEASSSSNPSSSETREATRRIDDATVAVRAQLQLLFEQLQGGTGMYDQSAFETASGLTWTTATT